MRRPSGDFVKIFWHDGVGVSLYIKRLERGRLMWPLTVGVKGFERRRPSRKPSPEHLPRERVVVPVPTSCGCCGSEDMVSVRIDRTSRSVFAWCATNAVGNESRWHNRVYRCARDVIDRDRAVYTVGNTRAEADSSRWWRKD